jgi:hypothetical protein
VSEFWIQSRPPGPKSFYVRVMILNRYRPIATSKMIRVIMSSAGGVTAMCINFLLPSAAELRATITASKITSMIKINFNVTRNNIIISCRIYYGIKILASPRLT